MTERTVRFTEDFFDRLEELLPAERGADGIPSITDFLAFEIPGLRDLLAADAIGFTTATVIHGVRAYVNGGVLVPAILLYLAVDDHDVTVFDISLGREEPIADLR